MSNYSPSLQEFVDPLAICQPETDLGNILSIFQHLNCKMLAIPQDKLGWGIIHGSDLLSLVTEAWLGDRIALTSHPRSISYQSSQHNVTYRLIPEVKTLIKPVMIYQAEMALDEFLHHRQQASLLTEEQTFLIVNQQGELQGRLDRDKVIRYLALKSSSVLPGKQSAPKPKLDDHSAHQLPDHYLNCLTSLLEAIAVPSRIETATGQVIQSNQLWQKSCSEHPEILPQISPLGSHQTAVEATTKYWLEDQLTTFLADSSVENYRHPDRSCDLAPPSGEKLELPTDSLKQEQQKVSNWKYLKIPWQIPLKISLVRDQVTRGEPNSLSANLRDLDSSFHSHYLVLATPVSRSSNSQTSCEGAVETAELVNHQLLGTVSHELKSPLTGIVGLSSLLQAQKIGNLNQRQDRYVELIYRSGKKMMAVVEDLLQLTALMADPPQDSEVINIELLCSQLYHEVLTRIQSLEGKLNQPNSAATLVQLQLRIEPDREMTTPMVTQSGKGGESLKVIANKLLLSSVLSHLMLEAIVANETDEPLDIQIKSLSGMTAIVITGQAMPSMDNPGLNLMIAKCLSELLAAKVIHTCSKTSSSNNCQFTLLLPSKVSPPSPELEDATLSPSSVPSNSKATNLTILCLYPELEVIDPQANHDHNSNFDLKSWSDNYEAQTGYQHRIIEADSLEQAHNLARIWQFDAIILNGHQIVQPSLYLRSLQESLHLATLPLITLDTRTTEAANQIEGLNVYPCLLPAQQRNIADLIQVIQIAIES
jgi:signal transduction histidine kinase